MPKRVLLPLLALALLSCLPVHAKGLAASYPPLPGDAALEAALLAYTNQARAEYGLPPLRFDDSLALAARHHAADMARLHYLSHDSPDPDTATLAKRVARAGLALQTVAENIAAFSNGPTLARQAVDGWLASPGHRANLLSTTYSHVGFGAETDDRGVTYLVQDFAYRPIILERASLHPYRSQGYELELSLRLTVPQEVLFVYGETSGPPVHIGAGRQSVRLTVPAAERLHLSAGVKSSGASYILEDEGWIDLSLGLFQPSPSAPRHNLAIDQVKVTPRESSGYRVELDFDGPPRSTLAVWLNGKQLRPATLNGDTLHFDLPQNAERQVIDLGLSSGGNRYQVIMSFALDTSQGLARLVPHVK